MAAERMTDDDHAAEIRLKASELNDALQSAACDGLLVTLEVHAIQFVAGAAPCVSAKISRPL